MAATVELPPPPAPSIPTKHVHNCPECGTSIQLDTGEVEMARRKIVELEAQMEFLKEKATAAGRLLSSAQADTELLNELERERALRAKAEERAEKVDSEIEELSVQLFSQANEMVATERKARAKLEERIEILERKDKDKMARLDRLEKAVSRIDRVKAILNQPQTNGVAAGGAMLAPPAKR
ncbi:hypothetical protein SNOG_10113 [Parastagonospora nodorum SN15]|uniref:GDP/GTP exchange factor Sec2 N-terminal domain-containing protein n=1 Tax=Phaeosphaeria nodorum (strain SN15 / ATCC MYA-4574 / FGSC 10173) TaxID=321614 RepID=Q0UDQ1_PHANO|nr:hypothetical protein SNOG_10113 [Parastagonospora nodorum SN15]EAT82448.2 hypothetical protein SNOG_10113 [Parastagonospora nodorum SN15]